VSPLASGGYPTLEASAQATSGLSNPDAIMGAVAMGTTTTVVYVEKTLNADTSFPATQQCPNTPSSALTNLVNGKARKPNHDVIAVRVATMTDGIIFNDVGIAAGLNVATTTALNGIRWLGRAAAFCRSRTGITACSSAPAIASTTTRTASTSSVTPRPSIRSASRAICSAGP